MAKHTRPRRLRSRRSFTLYSSLAGIVALAALLYLTLSAKDSQSLQKTEAVVIANDVDFVLIPAPSRQVARGELLSSVPFTTIKWPKSGLPGNYMRNISNYQEARSLTSLPQLMPVPLSALKNGPLAENAVVEGIPAGMRAITVRVDIESAVEGWARSGNFVDVIVIRQSDNQNSGLESKIIAQNVRILSAGRSAEPIAQSGIAPRAPATVTLLVSQTDALKIKTAASFGKLTFALRGLGDNSPTSITKMDQSSLLGRGRLKSFTPVPFRGYARGPDGKVYVLQENARWTRSSPSAFGKTQKPDSKHTQALE